VSRLLAGQNPAGARLVAAKFTLRRGVRIVAEPCALLPVIRVSKLNSETETMTLLLILLVGGIIGWLASILMRTDAQQGIFLNIVVGVVGAVIAGFIITPLIGGAPITSGAFDIMSLFASFLGAVVLLAIVNLFRRGSVR
jgi:uncharacterized membrane protein YeaQ/YmgE (transglycosylase-associated protein family)